MRDLDSPVDAAPADDTHRTLPPLHGLLLSGGRSVRMGRDKALLDAGGVPQLLATFGLLARHVERCFVSLRADQRGEPVRASLPGIVDEIAGIGPAAGLLAARQAHPSAAWLVVACDLPRLQDSTLSALIAARDGRHAAVAYASAHDGLPEPLCALWEPAALAALATQVEDGRSGLRSALQSVDLLLLPADRGGALDNANTWRERAAAARGSRD